MIPRYTRPEMAAIWTPESRFGIWLEIETLAEQIEAHDDTFGVPARPTIAPR